MAEPPNLPPDLASVLCVVRRLCEGLWARVPTHLGLRWSRDEPVTWLPLAGTRSGPAEAKVREEQPFVPSIFQESILEALEGKGLRTDALGAAVGDRSRLYKPGGLKELQAQGWVSHHPRVGYYRKDAPPPELREVGG
jgi:hypothetical protein